MLTIHVKNNPFQRAKTSTVDFEARTLREIVTPWMTDGEFQYPTVVRVNGVPRLRADWDSVVEDGSSIEIAVVVGATLATVLIVANVVSLIATAAFTAYGIYKARKAMRAFAAGVGQYDADPFFSVDGHGNKANLNGPVEVAYGKNRIWPSYIARPYKNYIDDGVSGFAETGYVKNTRLLQIFCIGQGEFDIHSVQIGDTQLESYKGMRYEIINPGQVSSANLARIMYVTQPLEEDELLINESSAIVPMSPPGVGTNRFEIDIETSAQGTYHLQATFYLIDDSNVVNAAQFVNITLDRPADFAGNPAPHRHTFQVVLDTSANYRYGCKLKYNSHDGTPGTIKIVEMRSFADPTIPLGYSDKTLLVVEYFATALDDDLATDRVNVVATRKLKTIHEDYSGRIEITQPTRSIPWAIYDVLTNSVYGGGLAETYIDIESFSQLHGELEREGVFFDYVFNQGTTVEDAAKVIASAGRCAFTYNGSKLALVRESGNPIPEAMFGTENIVDGSFSWSSELFDPTEPDGVEVGYVEPESGQLNTVVFTPEGSSLNSVQKLSPQGIGSRTQAWREAAFRMRKLQFVRDTFKFKTGLEGYIPTIGSIAALSQDLTGMGTSGYVENYENGSLYLSKEVLLNTAGSIKGRILLRADDGSAMGPFDITSFVAGSAANMSQEVFIGDIGFDIDFWRVDREPSHFIAWAGSGDAPVATKIRIETVTPSDDNTVEITATNYDQRVYEFDAIAPPDVGDDETPVDSGTGAVGVAWVHAKKIDTHTDSVGNPYVRIWWGRNYGATSYKVYKNSVLVWSGTDTYVDIPMVGAFNIQIGVSAMNGAVESTTTDIIFDLAALSVSNPRTYAATIDSDGISIRWDDVVLAESYEVRALVGVTYSPWYPCEATNFKFTKTMFAAAYGRPVSSIDLGITLYVRGIANGAAGAISAIATSIPKPSAPSGVVITQDPQIVSSASFVRKRSFVWEGSDDATFTIYAEAYKSGYESATLDIKPWVRLTTTDKKAFTTTKAIPEVFDIGKTIYPLSDNPSQIYGNGWSVQVGFSGTDVLLNQGELIINGLFVYQAGSEWSGKFHPMIKEGGTQFSGLVWVGNIDAAELSGAVGTIILPQTLTDSATGHDWRCKGAIVADNGWFDSSAVSFATFDIDL